MRILILTQWFDPEPTFKGLAFAKELVKRGHEVEVLTGFPNYPGGRLYPGYRVKLLQRESRDGISVIRVPLYPSHDRSGVRRIVNYVSFALAAGIMAPFLVRRADVAYVYHPPATIAFPAFMLKVLRGIPFVYDVQDLWPDTLQATGMVKSRILLRLTALWCGLTYKIADRIAVLSPGFKAKLQEAGVPAEKISVIYNWCDETQLMLPDRAEAERCEPTMAGRFNIVFAGTMGKAQALDTVIDAAAQVADKAPAVQFVLIGGGIDRDRLEQSAKDRKLANIVFLPRRPVAEVGSVLAMADVLLVHLKDDPLFEITIPSKTQAYLAAGKPILMAMKGDAAELVEQTGAGIACMPNDAASLVNAILSLAAMTKENRESMGAKGRAFYCKELSLEAGTRKFDFLMRAAAGIS